MTSLALFILITFLAGIYFYTKPTKEKEAFSSKSKVTVRCPNLLIQKDSNIYLYNSKLATVPGVNPVVFENLEDYVEFLDWQRSQGIHCPVLFLQQTYDAQGAEVYKVRPNILNPEGGIPPVSAASVAQRKDDKMMKTLLVDSTHNDQPFNQGSYPSYDGTPYYIGMQTPLDEMDREVKSGPVSPNAMDDNWGGAQYTQSLIDRGYYKGNEVSIQVA